MATLVKPKGFFYEKSAAVSCPVNAISDPPDRRSAFGFLRACGSDRRPDTDPADPAQRHARGSSDDE